MSAVSILLRKELTDCLRDRRTLVLMLAVPVLLYPGLLAFIGYMATAGKERLAREELTVAVVGPDAALLVGAPPPHTTFRQMTRKDAERALAAKEIAAAVDAPSGSGTGLGSEGQAVVTVLYTKRHDRSMEALERMRRSIHEVDKKLLQARLLEKGMPPTFAEPVKAEELDLDFGKNVGALIASRVLPSLLLAMLLMGALYPAIDLTAGEKERGTLETLLVAPVRPMQVMAAKYLTVAIIATAASLANLGAMAMTFRLGFDFAGAGALDLTLTGAQVLTLLACLVPAALLSSGLSLAVASVARSFKEAQNLLTPLVLVGTVPGMVATAPGVELDAATSAVPLLNVALLIKATMLGPVNPAHVAATVASVLACSVLALWLAANAFRSERLRFGGAESWRDLFRFGKAR